MFGQSRIWTKPHLAVSVHLGDSVVALWNIAQSLAGSCAEDCYPWGFALNKSPWPLTIMCIRNVSDLYARSESVGATPETLLWPSCSMATHAIAQPLAGTVQIQPGVILDELGFWHTWLTAWITGHVCFQRLCSMPEGICFSFFSKAQPGQESIQSNPAPCSHSSEAKHSRGTSQQHFGIESEEDGVP